MKFTFIIEPYTALTTVMTAVSKGRTKLNSVRITFAQSRGVIVALFIRYLTGFFGGNYLATGYQVTVIILAIITSVFLIYSYSKIKERIKSTSHLDPVKVKDIFIGLGTNHSSIIL